MSQASTWLSKLQELKSEFARHGKDDSNSGIAIGIVEWLYATGQKMAVEQSRKFWEYADRQIVSRSDEPRIWRISRLDWRFQNEPPGARRTLHEFWPATLEVEFFRLACRAGDLLPTELRARYEPANWMTIDGTDPGLHPLDVSALPSDYQPGPESELPAPLCWLALLHRDLI